MGVYELMMKAMEERDAAHYTKALHDDYEFVRHQSGTTMNKTQMSEMMVSMMANTNLVISESRCIYENDEILVVQDDAFRVVQDEAILVVEDEAIVVVEDEEILVVESDEILVVEDEEIL